MNTPKKPVQPWIPERKPPPPRQAVRVVKRPPSAAGVLRAGWMVTLLMGVLNATGMVLMMLRIEAGAGVWFYLTLLAYPAAIAVLVLAIIGMARGAAVGGVLLLVGAPVLYFALVFGVPFGLAALHSVRK